MMDTKTIDLIQRELDGELSPSERSTLASIIAANPEAADLRRSLRAVSRSLQSLHPRTAPPALKPSIMRRLEARQRAPRPRSPILAGAVGFIQSLDPRRAFVGGLVTGLAVALIAMVVVVPAALQERDLSGAMLLTGSSPVVAPTARVPVADAGVRGMLTMESTGQYRIATVDLIADETVGSAIVSYPDDMVRLAAVRPHDAGSAPLAAGDGRVELGRQGRTRVELFFTVLDAPTAPLRLTLTTVGGTEHTTETRLKIVFSSVQLFYTIFGRPSTICYSLTHPSPMPNASL